MGLWRWGQITKPGYKETGIAGTPTGFLILTGIWFFVAFNSYLLLNKTFNTKSNIVKMDELNIQTKGEQQG